MRTHATTATPTHGKGTCRTHTVRTDKDGIEEITDAFMLWPVRSIGAKALRLWYCLYVNEVQKTVGLTEKYAMVVEKSSLCAERLTESRNLLTTSSITKLCDIRRPAIQVIQSGNEKGDCGQGARHSPRMPVGGN